MGLITDTNHLKVVVAGSSGGIGSACVQHLLTLPNLESITGLSRSQTNLSHPKFTHLNFDLTDEASILQAASSIEKAHLIIIATGILHDGTIMPEKNLGQLNPDNLQNLFTINTIGPALLIKHLSNKLVPKEHGLIAVLSAKVGSITDNFLGGWYGYRASKSALNMIVKTAAIEMHRGQKNHSIVSLHPGTVKTKLSDPFTANYPENKLIEPDDAAKRLLSVIDNLNASHNGQFIHWDGSNLPY